MCAALYPDILRDEGFQLVSQLNYRVSLESWWNPSPHRLLQVTVLAIGGSVLIKGDKTYYMKSITREGETWARDLGSLHDYLEDHFPELRLSFSHFRDVPPSLALSEVRRRMAIDAPTQSFPSVEDLARIQERLRVKQQEIWGSARLVSLSNMPSDLLTGYLHQQTRRSEHDVRGLDEEVQRQRERLDLVQVLQREYQKKGSAAVYSFTISSNLQTASGASNFLDALRAVVKELSDQHRYHVVQKLRGGRLNVQVAEAESPEIAWMEQWFGGALSPGQLDRLGLDQQTIEPLLNNAFVTPDEPIVVDGHTRAAEKRVAAKVVSTMLQRLDKTESNTRRSSFDPESIAPDTMPLELGLRIENPGLHIDEINSTSSSRAVFPFSRVVHGLVSGTTGSGKSFFARVFVEEASKHAELSILVLDPRNQFVGLLVPEDRQDILRRYDDFGMDPKQARGFPFDYFAPSIGGASPLPKNLSSLAAGRSIVSFKSMDDRERCGLAAQILEAVFKAKEIEESDRPKLLVVIDEAQLMTRKRVAENAKGVAAQTEIALDRIAREGRKYGIVLLLLSQTIRDFSYELAALRQMSATKVFLSNSDRELEYAADVIGDGRALVQLPPGVAIIHNASWGVQRIRVRPPYSKVCELRDEQIGRLLKGPTSVYGVSAEARKVLSSIEGYCKGGGGLNMSEAGRLLGITSKRRLQELVAELEQASLIYTRKLAERGQPREIRVVAGEWEFPKNRSADLKVENVQTLANSGVRK